MYTRTSFSFTGTEHILPKRPLYLYHLSLLLALFYNFTCDKTVYTDLTNVQKYWRARMKYVCLLNRPSSIYSPFGMENTWSLVCLAGKKSMHGLTVVWAILQQFMHQAACLLSLGAWHIVQWGLALIVHSIGVPTRHQEIHLYAVILSFWTSC